jgi:hypothetical protein
VNNTSQSAVNLSGGTLGGNGTVAAITATGGTVAPGNGPGTLVASGNVTFNATTAFSVEIGGTTPGTQYDVLSVSSGVAKTVNLGGANLTGSLINGFNAAPATQFTIITNNSPGGTITGQFAQGTSIVIDGQLFTITYNTNSLVLTAVALTWDGGGADNNWSTAANWNPATVPIGGDPTTMFAAGVLGRVFMTIG